MSKEHKAGFFVKLGAVVVLYALYVAGISLKAITVIVLLWIAASLVFLGFKIDPPKKG